MTLICTSCNTELAASDLEIYENVDGFLYHCPSCMRLIALASFEEIGIPQTKEEADPYCVCCDVCQEEGINCADSKVQEEEEEKPLCYETCDFIVSRLNNQEIDYLIHIINKQMAKVSGAYQQLETTKLKLLAMIPEGE